MGNDDQTAAPMTTPPADAGATVDPARTANPAAPATARTTAADVDDVGPYRIVGRLGEGGMGTVYRAEQTHPIRRTVAVKVVRADYDSDQIVARFEAERQALARMDHPAIAKVLDAGSDARGRPYFVMEYVPGVPVTDFCDAEQLSVADRLCVFLQVCDAVAHAHIEEGRQGEAQQVPNISKRLCCTGAEFPRWVHRVIELLGSVTLALRVTPS